MKTLISTLSTLAVIALLAAPNTVAAAQRAILIGIGDYPHVNKLAGPQDDVTNMQKLLVDHMGYQSGEILSLVDDEATRDGILSALDEWFAKQSSADDELLFYFSGHGFQNQDENGDEADQRDEAIAPYNVQAVDGVIRNMITDDEIDQIFSRLADRKLTVIIDSCHSGTLTRGVFDAEQQAFEKTIPAFNALVGGSVVQKDIDLHREEKAFIESTPTRTVWTAVSAWQKALVDFEIRNGSVFTNRFIRGLGDKQADANKDGVVAHAELLQYLRDQSNEFCERNQNNCRAGLTPTLEVSKDLILAPLQTQRVEPIAVEGSVNPPVLEQVIQPSIENSQPAEPTARALADDLVSLGNRGGLELKTSSEERLFKLNELVSFQVTSQQAGYLLLFDLNANDELVQIFPNQFTDTDTSVGWLEAGETLVLPNESLHGFSGFEAQEPLGRSKIIAVLTPDAALPSSVTQQKDLVIVVQSQEYLNDLAASLMSVWSQDEQNRAVQWSVATLDYEIRN